jgi:hypothetical protein
MTENIGQSAVRIPSPSLVATMRTVPPSVRRGTASIITPTRTIRLTEAEQQAAAAASVSPGRYLSAEALSNRPRSNPHSRTPRRYESPLNSNEFRNIRNDPSDATRNNIFAIGTTVPEGGGVGGNHRPGTMTPGRIRSQKQDLPSHRKVRRWNNDHFVDLASEIGKNSTKAADVLRLASKDAHLYVSIYDPAEHKPSKEVEQ